MKKVFKRVIVVLVSAIMLLQLFGCSSNGYNGVDEAYKAGQEVVGMPNPMVEYENANAFKQILGIEIDVDELYLEDPKFFIIDNKLAEIQDTKQGVADDPLKISIRGQKTTEDISGIYDDNMETDEFDYDGIMLTHRISDACQAEIYDWYVGDIHYCVSVIGEASQMEVAQIMDLAIVACK